jgi:exodeoxyribonuclease V alpha subunit
MTAAFLTEAVFQGHVCINLAQRKQALFQTLSSLIPSSLDDWRTCLEQSNVVGKEGDYCPLILTQDDTVYLYQFWQKEQRVADAIKQFNETESTLDTELLRADMQAWSSTIEGIDWQKIAVLAALRYPFTVISGGPGTGKTTIVLKLLALLYKQYPTWRVALAAPTGKAAARLQSVVSEQVPYEVQAKTLHRLLGISPNNEQGHYGHNQAKLPYDVIIIDESSMIDISLMAKLLVAISPSTKLVLVGDSHQLASVESGAVLANLCDKGMAFDSEFIELVKLVTGFDVSEYHSLQPLPSYHVVQLQHSYRFDSHSVIGQLALAVNTGQADEVIQCLSSNDGVWEQEQGDCISGYQAYFDAIETFKDPQTCLALFEQYRVLCATKQGTASVAMVNRTIQTHLTLQGWRATHDFYHGRPILITQNDYRQQIFNGDTGLILKDGTGALSAYFMVDNQLKNIALSRLPAHETAFAITIHKSQGSEFDHVSILLPDEPSPMLNRELLYTAITRAKSKIHVLASEDMIRHAVNAQFVRETGLVKRIHS